MATVTITLRDNEDSIDVSLEFEPRLPRNAADYTPAHRVAIRALDCASERGGNEILDSEVE
jgi:hypothetical protein